MANGFFPLERTGENGKRLAEMAVEIEKIHGEMMQSVAEYCTPEDAAQDGSYLERLWMASEFINHCLTAK